MERSAATRFPGSWSWPLGATAVLASGVLLLVEGVRPTTVPDRITLRCVSLMLLSVGGLVVVGSRRNRSLGLGSMHAGSWYLVWFGIGFGLTSLAWRNQQEGTNARITQESVLLTLLFLHAAVIAWLLGYLVGPGRLMTRLGRRIASGAVQADETRVRGASTPWILFGISVLGRLVQLTGGRFGYVGDPSQLLTNPASTGQLVNVMVQCGNYALIVAAIAFTQQRTTASRVTMITLTATQVVLGSLAGGKQHFILAVLAPAMVLAVRGRFPWKVTSAALVVFIIGVVPFIQAYRENSRSADYTLTPSDAFRQAPEILEDTLTRDAGSRFRDTVDLMSDRTRQIDNFAVVVQTTPTQYAYHPPSDYLYAPVLGLIPRIIWSSKPVVSSGAEFARVYLGTGPGVYTSAAIPPVADLYQHGGPLVLLVGMFVIGAMIRLVDRTLHPRHDLRLVIIYFPFFLQFIKAEAALTSVIAGLPLTLLTASLVCRFAFRPKASSTATTHPAPRTDASAIASPKAAPSSTVRSLSHQSPRV
ncbi:conserved membrane hypothetical protein [Frankia sp. Hr75.2]|nr:conserved membrane hypothetical protein [Frankia sp. Hr75.2]